MKNFNPPPQPNPNTKAKRFESRWRRRRLFTSSQSDTDDVFVWGRGCNLGRRRHFRWSFLFYFGPSSPSRFDRSSCLGRLTAVNERPRASVSCSNTLVLSDSLHNVCFSIIFRPTLQLRAAFWFRWHYTLNIKKTCRIYTRNHAESRGRDWILLRDLKRWHSSVLNVWYYSHKHLLTLDFGGAASRD